MRDLERPPNERPKTVTHEGYGFERSRLFPNSRNSPIEIQGARIFFFSASSDARR